MKTHTILCLPITFCMIALFILINSSQATGQQAGDFRSKSSGNWNSVSTWQTFDGADWNDAVNFPTSSDGEITIINGHTVTANISITIDQTIVESGAALIAPTGILTLADVAGSDLLVNGTLHLSGASLFGPGAALVASGGAFLWTSGTISNSATLNLDTGSAATFNPGATNLTLAGTLNNSGTFTMVSGNLVQSGSPSLFTNLANGIIELNGWLTPASSWGANLDNQGMINKNNGAVQFTLNATTCINSGTININSGEFHINTNTFTHTGSITALPGGTVRASSGNFNHNAGGTISVPFTQSGGILNINTPLSIENYTFSGGQLNGPQAVSIISGGIFTWTGGFIANNAILTLDAGSAGTFNPGNTNLFLTGTLNNSGTFTMVSGNLLQSGTPSLFNNLSSGIINLNGWFTNSSSWGANLDNQGIINKNNGAVQFTLNATTCINSGTIHVNSGEFHINTNTFTHTGSITALPGGTARASSGNFNHNTGGTISVPFTQSGGILNINTPLAIENYTFSGGQLNGPQAVSIISGGIFTWTGGFIANNAILTLDEGSAGTFNPGNTNLFLSGTLNNSSTFTMQSGNLVQSGTPSLFNNLSSGIINLNGWLTNSSSWGANLDNQGIINKNNGAVQFTLNAITCINSGTININSGEFHINTSTFTHTGSITALPGGTVRASSGNFNHNTGGTIIAPFTQSGGNLNINTPLSIENYAISGGQLNGPQAVSIISGGIFTWTGGFIANNAILTLDAGSAGTFNPGNTNLFLSGTLNNSSTFTMQSGNLLQSGSPSLFNNLASGIIHLNGWQSLTSSWTANLDNQGIINKNNGVVPFTLNNTTTTSSGTIHINSGEFHASATTFNHTGSIIGNTGTSLKTSTTNFNHNNGASFTSLPTFIITGGICHLNAGSTVNTLDQLSITSGTLNCGIEINTEAFTFSGGTLNGSQAVNVTTDGTFLWTGGTIGSSAILNLASGSTSTCNPGNTNLFLSGTLNNSGTFTMQSGNLLQSGSPSLFNNLASGIIHLNGWQSLTSSWTANLDNQGIINKNNGVVPFTLNNTTTTSSGTIHINSGEFHASATTFNHTGSIIGNTGTSLKTSTTNFNHNNGASFTSLPTFIITGGICHLNAGSTVNTLDQLSITSGTLNCGIEINTEAFTFSGGTLNGTQAVNVTTDGTFLWTGGTIGSSAILNLASGSTSTCNPGNTNLFLSGTLNNSGTFTMQSGNLLQSGSPSLFNNLASGIIHLNGWQSLTSSWTANLDNQGIINKNNGVVTFTLNNTTTTSSGTIHINSGEFHASATTFNHTGSIIGNTGTSLKTSTTNFNHNNGASFTSLPTFIITGGICHLNAGSTVNTLDQLSITSGTLNCGIEINTEAFTFSGGTLNGTQAVNVTTDGTFLWTGGTIGSSAILNLASGSTSTCNPGNTNLFLSGTLNNSSTFTMLSGNLLQSGSPSLFNNLASGIIHLNGWQSLTNSWSANLNNQGTIHKNNGTVPFTFTSGSYLNQIGAIWNINSGTWTHNTTLATQSGSINVANGATFTSPNALNFAGISITNNGSITTSSVTFVGSATQQLGGNGSINTLNINNAEGVNLIGDQQVNNAITFTNGLINAPANALVLASSTTVNGANATRYVNGFVRWHYPTGSNITRVFPIGGSSAFTPLNVQFANISANGSLTAASLDGDHPNVNTSLIDPGKSVNRHWLLDNNGIAFSTANTTFTWASSEVDPGANSAIFAVSKFNNPNWAFSPSSSPLSTSIQSIGLTAFGGFQIGEPCIAPNLSTQVTDATCFEGSDGAITLTVTGGTPIFSFLWSNGANSQNITALPQGEYSVVATTEGGCIANASATVNQPPALEATISAINEEFCAGNSTTIEVSGPANGTVTIEVNGEPGPVIPLDAFGNGSIGTGPLSITTIYSLVTASSTECSNSVSGSVQIIVNPNPVVTCGTYGIACDIDPLIPLTGSPIGGIWSGVGVSGDNFDPGTGTQLLTYNFTDENDCNNTCSVTIQVEISSTFFADADGDGAGDPEESIQTCEQPEGFVTNSLDNCPNDPLKTDPGICGCGTADTDTDGDDTPDCIDGCPNDPNKTAPGACGCGVADVPFTWFADADGDGFGDPNSSQSGFTCIQPTGFVANNEDCDDSNANVHPNASDSNCDGIDNNCNGETDEDFVPQNCKECVDGEIINTLLAWFADTDGDGFGDPNDSQEACEQPVGFVSNNLDNCPNDPLKTDPGICGCGTADSDSDGDGTPDCIDGCPNDPNKTAPGACGCGVADVPFTWFADADGDGFGDPNSSQSGFTCIQPSGFVANSQDCDDTNANVNPNASDSNCDGIDNNCNGETDEDFVPENCEECVDGEIINTLLAWFADTDGDGFGDPNDSQEACEQPVGFVSNNLDNCPNDPLKTDPGICGCGTADSDSDGDGTPDCIDGCPNDPNKTAPGACGCGVADVPFTWFADADGDGFGDPNSSQSGFTCIQPSGFVANSQDCDDTNANVNPNASDSNCDGIDNNCNGETDEDFVPENCEECVDGEIINTLLAWFADTDGDGFGDPNDSQEACEQPVGFVSNNLDNCPNDPLKTDPGICGCGTADSDSDGDGTPDCIDGCPNDPNKTAPGACGCGVADVPFTWFADADGDGFGDPNSSQSGFTCIQPTGFVANNEDCDDSNANVHPNASDSNCDGIDNNCNGETDEDFVPQNCKECVDGEIINTLLAWFADTDGDGFGDPNDSQEACEQPVGFVSNNLDNCPNDPLKTDPGICGCGTADSDSDGDGTPDCIDGCPNDPNKTAPGACGCGVADVPFTWFADADGDGFGDPNSSQSGFTCIQPSGFVANSQDCDDTNANVNPNASDSNCDGIDNNCNGETDEDFVPQNCEECVDGEIINTLLTWFADTDGDGFGDPENSQEACEQPEGFVSNSLDNCPNDPLKTDPGICGCGTADTDTDGDDTPDCIDGCPNDPNKTAPGACGCGVEDVPFTWFADTDGDGFGDPNNSQSGFTCIQPVGFVANNEDCDDQNPLIHPGAVESCNGTDDNCNGLLDEGCGALTISGLGNEVIVNGSETPNPFDGTNMGSAILFATLDKTFVIHNTGNNTIELSGNPIIQLEGDEANFFSVLSQPANSTLGAGESVTFVIRYLGNSAFGLKEAIVVVPNTDPGNDPYQFTIAAATSGPKIQIRGNAVNINNGDMTPIAADFTDFGVASYNGNRSRSFAIHNLGSQVLSLTGTPVIQISGEDSDKFTVTAVPATQISPNSNRQFAIRFDGTEVGVFHANVTVLNNDLANGEYVFAIKGTVLSPNMQVRFNSVSGQIIENGDDEPGVTKGTDYGLVAVNAGKAHTFYIRNLNGGLLSLIGTPRVQLTGADAGMFTVTTTPALNISAGSSSIMRVAYQPKASGVHEATIVIPTNEPGKNPYTFNIKGQTPNASGFYEPGILEASILLEEAITADIYPNPAYDELHLTLQGIKEPTEAFLIDAYGRKVKTVILDNGNNQIMINDLPNGIYVVVMPDLKVVPVTFFKK
jgi:hypothetical protein